MDHPRPSGPKKFRKPSACASGRVMTIPPAEEGFRLEPVQGFPEPDHTPDDEDGGRRKTALRGFLRDIANGSG